MLQRSEQQLQVSRSSSWRAERTRIPGIENRTLHRARPGKWLSPAFAIASAEFVGVGAFVQGKLPLLR